jgi:hypothetical protein
MPLSPSEIVRAKGMAVGAWAVIGVMVAGCGYLTRRVSLLARSGAVIEPLQPGDFWIGLAALTMYLLLWSLLLPVDGRSWIASTVAGAACVALGVRDRHGVGFSIPSPGPCSAGCP